MGTRSAVNQLPDDVKAELHRRLMRSEFSGYVALEEWLQAQGFAISKSALHRYGQRFEDRLSALKVATDQAKAIAESAPDDAGFMSDALARLVQERLFGVLVDLDEKDALENLPKIAKAAAEINRSSVSQKKWMLEVRQRAEVAAAAVEQTVKKAGLSSEAADQIRRQILGIAS